MTKQQEAPGRLEAVRSFVNTIDLEEETEELGSPEELVTWLQAQGLASEGIAATPAELERAIGLREALRAVLLSHNGGPPPPAESAATLDDAARRARVQLRFHGESADATLEPDAGGVEGALGRILAIVHAAMADGTWNRLKACREHSCEWAFYDHTKNRSGAWCDMGVCGNRAKARAFRERSAAESRPSSRRP